MGGDVSTHLILRLNQKIFSFLNTNDPAWTRISDSKPYVEIDLLSI